MPWVPTPEDSAYHRLGGSDAVRALVEAFYDAMDEGEPALSRLHACDDQGRVSRDARDRFAMFLVGWLGGPQDYIAQHGHPRLRMRHARVPVDEAMRNAWLRAMKKALDARAVEGELRGFLDGAFTQAADFLRNR